MPEITVTFPIQKKQNYAIKIQSGLLENIKWLPNTYEHIVIITDDHVCSYYGESFSAQLKHHGFHVLLLPFPAGEKSKNAKIKQKLEEQILSHGYGRNDTLILALGGGVTGDLAGFVAATYMRGIPYIQIPTTLLAMVDSSVGGKVGINTPQGKNLIGAFWQPLSVIADIKTLKTLDKQQIIAGLIEAIKMFLTNDAPSYHFLFKNLSPFFSFDETLISELIYRAVKIKAYVVSKDEKEKNQRMILNFGHTIAHALEKISGYKILHGIAVGYGILIEAKISQIMGILSEKDFNVIQSCLASLGIYGKALKKYPIEKIIELTYSDKKATSGMVRYVLLKKIGAVHVSEKNYAHFVSEKIVREAILICCQ